MIKNWVVIWANWGHVVLAFIFSISAFNCRMICSSCIISWLRSWLICPWLDIFSNVVQFLMQSNNCSHFSFSVIEFIFIIYKLNFTMFKFTLKRYLLVMLLVTVWSVLFNCPVNIILSSVNTSVLAVPSYWGGVGAVFHSYTSFQWEFIGVLFFSMPISFTQIWALVNGALIFVKYLYAHVQS